MFQLRGFSLMRNHSSIPKDRNSILPPEKIKGVRYTRQGESAFVEDFEKREDPRHQPYYWLAGSYKMQDTDQDTDAWALDAGYVSVTPISYDLTAYEVLPTLNDWGLKV